MKETITATYCDNVYVFMSTSTAVRLLLLQRRVFANVSVNIGSSFYVHNMQPVLCM